MDTPIRTRQQLYDMIRETSKEEFIMNEMVRLGFWKEETGKPSVPKQLIEDEGKLNRELNELLKKKKLFSDQEKILKDMRKKRMEEAKAKREETKKKREVERVARAEAWAKQKETDIVYLGEGVSAGMNDKATDEEKLKANGLEAYEDVKALADAIGITVGQLRFLAFTRKTSKISHYVRFDLPKKTGGVRTISAPMPFLKNAQYWIMFNILYKVTTHHLAHGFVPTRSIKTNAEPHIGQDVVINMDLKNFFPTLNYKRVKGMFKSLGYSQQMATIFGLLCTEPEMDKVTLDKETYFVAKGERFLPQGAPTSPMITNIICQKLDKRLSGLAEKFGFTYTRYADDLTFSASGEATESVRKILWSVGEIVKDEGFVLHPKKTKVMRNGSKKEVTGIVVNEKMNTDRKTLRKFRALLHQIETTGIKGKTWGNGDIRNTIRGYANFVNQVNPAKGKAYLERVEAILKNC